MATSDPNPVDFADLTEDVANGFLRDLMEVAEDSPWWCAEEWSRERAILNRLFHMGQQHERERQATER